MISIQLRIKYNLPVIISGETGCGKSSLIRQLCAIIGTRLRTLNIHGGMEDRDITRWMRKQIREAEALTDPMDRVVVFFDEVGLPLEGGWGEGVCGPWFPDTLLETFDALSVGFSVFLFTPSQQFASRRRP